MSLHLLGVSRSEDVDSAESEIHWVVDDGLAAATVRPLAGVAGPVRHAQFLETIHRRINILPFRYGVVLPDEASLREFLRARQQALLDKLERVAGAGEMGLRMELAAQGVSPTAETDGRLPATSASEYLALRRWRYQREDQRQQQVQRAVERSVAVLGGLSRQWTSLSPTEPGLARLAFLVDRDRWESFRGQAAELNGTEAIRQCFCLGPWPPYNFV